MIMPPYLQYPSRGSSDPLVLFTIRARVNMKTFLGLLIISITVSGNEEETVKGVLGQDILLPCSCSGRSVNEEVHWQIAKENETTPVLTYKGTFSDFHDYKDRVKIFLSEDNNNCSLLLSNLTLADQGTYRCSFYKPYYTYVLINLNVSVNYTVCQRLVPNNSLKVKVFQCDVAQQFPEDQIQWQLDGQPRKIPFTRNAADPSTGLYHLSSNFTMDLNESSEPKCIVTNSDIMTNINYDCTEASALDLSGRQDPQPVTVSVITPLVITAIVLLLVVSLVLRHRQISKRGMKENRGEVTNSDLEQLNASEHSKC